MKSLPLQAVAQDIVDAIKPLVGNRTINIMDTSGIIIASSDPLRLGTFHKGAADAAATRKPVRIDPSQVVHYPGAREGINLPVIKNGELLGIVGIYGVPSEVEQAANLLGACVDLYLDQAQSTRKTQLRKDLLVALMRRMLSGELLDREELLTSGRELGLDLRLPVRALVVRPGDRTDGREQELEQLERIHAAIGQMGALDPDRDVMAILNETVVVIKHVPQMFEHEMFMRRFHADLERQLGFPVSAALGGRSDDWRTLAVSHHEAATLAETSGSGWQCIDSPSAKVKCILKNSLGAGATDRYMTALRATVTKGFGDRDLTKRVMTTVRAYCDADCRGGKAAEVLGVHKNTMNYRINKILGLMGLENEHSFIKEFFLRLLLLHYQQEIEGKR